MGGRFIALMHCTRLIGWVLDVLARHKHKHWLKLTSSLKIRSCSCIYFCQGHLLELEMACGTKNAKEQLQEVQEVTGACHCR